MSSKKRKSSQFPSHNKSSSPTMKTTHPQAEQNLIFAPENTVSSTPSTMTNFQRVQPEKMSLSAHENIQYYLEKEKKTHLSQEDLNAVLRLSQHLRLFGLLSAVGYINQSNDQEGKVRQRTVPIWHCLLGKLIAPTEDLSKRQLMERIVDLTRNKPTEYMALWRKSLLLTSQWNFWARAYSQD
ncbi:hypothetical protein [Crocosphaera sp. XPORK-15E]|uniref:hypothetical protein n=1 Tax=Crocosphaera sp. XPORK-15E TaxID=3110247 RepID=UPI002B1F0F23|nr:hypothetical protein [Crocosphaera sp. XPORK-15E]MEA5537026.1 hypothetical protein [Crocosphaera sp. XPORK-15E]